MNDENGGIAIKLIFDYTNSISMVEDASNINFTDILNGIIIKASL